MSTALHDMMVTKHALRLIHCDESRLFQWGDQSAQTRPLDDNLTSFIENDDLEVGLAGKYIMNMTVDLLTKMKDGHNGVQTKIT